MHTYSTSHISPAWSASRVIWYLLEVIEVLLGLRFLLKLFVANPDAGFTNFVYSITQPLVAPFWAVFNITRVEGTTFEWSTLLAMVIYWLIAWGIIELFFTIEPPEETITRIDRH